MWVHIVGSLGVFVCFSIPSLVLALWKRWAADEQWKKDCREAYSLLRPAPQRPYQPKTLFYAFFFSLVVVVCFLPWK